MERASTTVQRAFVGLAAGLAAGAVLVACGSGGAGGGAGGAGGTDNGGPMSSVAENELPQELAKAYCAAGALCCGAAGLPHNANCVAERSAYYAGKIQEAKASGRTEYDPAMAAQCLAYLTLPAGCAESIDGNFPSKIGTFRACKDTFRSLPTREVGESCSDSSQCIPPPDGYAVCPFEGEVVGDFGCEQVHVAADGQACGGEQPDTWIGCREGSTCIDGVCGPLGMEGQACVVREDCQLGLVCTAGVCGSAGTSLPPGGVCADNSQCATQQCVLYRCASPARRGPDEFCQGNPDCLSDSCTYDSVAKRNECDPVSASSAAMVNATTCDTSAAPDAGR